MIIRSSRFSKSHPLNYCQGICHNLILKNRMLHLISFLSKLQWAFWYSFRCNSIFSVRNAFCMLLSHTIPSFPPTKCATNVCKSKKTQLSRIQLAYKCSVRTFSVQGLVSPPELWLLPEKNLRRTKSSAPFFMQVHLSQALPYLPLLNARARFTLLCADGMHHDLVRVLRGI